MSKIVRDNNSMFIPRQHLINEGYPVSYNILDNGFYLYKVRISANSANVYGITRSITERGKTTNIYGDLILTIDDYIGFWDGYDSETQDHGNSLLIKLPNNKYVYIGSQIYEFKLNDDEIIDYESPVGNSAVPYPVAVGYKYYYSLIDGVRAKKTYFRELGPYKNLHELGGDFYTNEIENIQEKLDKKIIRDREI